VILYDGTLLTVGRTYEDALLAKLELNDGLLFVAPSAR